jgi:hypothetical protein
MGAAVLRGWNPKSNNGLNHASSLVTQKSKAR